MKLIAEGSNGHEAVEQFRAQRPDITLMYLQMPEMSGIDDLLETIRGVRAGKKLIHAEVAAELAGHAINDALTERETEVLFGVLLGPCRNDLAVCERLTTA